MALYQELQESLITECLIECGDVICQALKHYI